MEKRHLVKTIAQKHSQACTRTEFCSLMPKKEQATVSLGHAGNRNGPILHARETLDGR